MCPNTTADCTSAALEGRRHRAQGAPGQNTLYVGCDVRKKVIDQYMHLLSAPFLAIAVDYLLEIIARDTVLRPAKTSASRAPRVSPHVYGFRIREFPCSACGSAGPARTLGALASAAGRYLVHVRFEALVVGWSLAGRARAPWFMLALAVALVHDAAGAARADFDACAGTECAAGEHCESRKQLSCGSAGGSGGVGGSAAGAGGSSSDPTCHADEVAVCRPAVCEHDDDCGSGEICFGTGLISDCQIVDPCPNDERCVVEPDGYESSCPIAIAGWCEAAQRCESDDECGDGQECTAYRSQCSCPAAANGERCGGGGQSFGGSGAGDGVCVCNCQSGLCVPEGQGAGGFGGSWGVGDPGTGGVGDGGGGATGSSGAGGDNAGSSSAGSGGGGPSVGSGAGAGGRSSAGRGASADDEAPSLGSGESEHGPDAGGCAATPGIGGTSATPASLLGLLAALALRRRRAARALGLIAR